MSNDQPPSGKQREQPRRNEAGERAAAEREARLAAALRANLHRRKAQSREAQAQSREAEARKRDAEAGEDIPKS
jgi:hypothetical protein